MYKTGSVLVLKEPRDPSPKLDRETGEPVTRGPKGKEKPVLLEFPYNRVVVIGESPINTDRGGWSGPDAKGVIIQPLTDFAGNLDEPFGKLRSLYNVESIPENEAPAEIKVRQINSATNEAGPTPEEIFSEKAPGKPPAEGQIRARTASPFEDITPKSDSPL